MRKEKKYHYIYKTTNLINGRYYYGMHSTNEMDDGYLGSGTYLRRAIKKHGNENFNREIIEFCKTRKELKLKEAKIVTLQEISNRECMNLRVGGAGSDTINYGIIPSKETIEKRRKVMMGHITSEETRRRISNSLKGHIISEETREKIRKTKTGVSTGPTTDETKIKIGNANRGTIHTEKSRKNMSNAHIGNRHTDETRKKISESSTGKVVTDKTKQKLREINLGKTLSDSHKHKLSIAHFGKQLNEITKQKISLALKGKPKKKLKCPHCNKVGGEPQMRQWHFSKCTKLT